jgi:acyl-CoA synthetase (AMP-forming)/AMP-acid ligase II
MDIRKTLEEQSQKYPQKPAIIFESQIITFSQLKDNAFKVANYLLGAGLKKSDKVGLCLPNIPDAVDAIFGTLSASGAIVPLDFMLTEEEIVNFLNHSQAKVLIAQPKKGIDLEAVKKRCPGLCEIIVYGEKLDNFSFWSDILETAKKLAPEVKTEDDALSSIFYTSGSTGHPKGVMLSRKHLSNPPQTINHFLGVSPQDVFLCGGVPFSHIGGLDFILVMLMYAPTLVLMSRFSPLEFLRNIQEHRVTIFCIVPAMYVAILSLKEYDKFDLSSLRYAVVFGAPSSPVLLKRFHKACPKTCVLNGWGMTETAAPNTYSPPDESKISSIGRFDYNMEAKIVDNSDNPVAPGERGELWLKGEPVTPGYYNEPELTKSAITEDGWLKTGDIATLGSDGLYYIVGRKKDMIKVAGEIVFSAEVEEKIHLHPKVREAAVIGVPDTLRGEVPKAFITPKQGQALSEEELRDFLKEHLAHFKMPHHYSFVADLPKNRTGKVDKTKLT